MRNTLDLLLLIGALIVFAAFCIVFPTDTLFSFLNILLGALCLILIFVAGRTPYGLGQIFHLANFVFLVIAARIEKSEEIVYWGGSASVLSLYETITAWSIVAIILFAAAHKYSFDNYRVTGYAANAKMSWTSQTKFSSVPLVLISICALAAIYQHNEWQILSVMLRGGVEDYRSTLTQTETLIFRTSVYPLPAICLIIYLATAKRSFVATLTLLSCMLIANPPTGMARWQAAMLYGAAAIVFFPQLFKMRYVLVTGMFIALLLVFPLLDAFRTYRDQLRLSISASWITQGHLDAMQTIARAMEIDFVTYGKQLLGPLLFFIPRAWWSEKPIGSGNAVADQLNLDLLNVSMHFFGEGYVNFGKVGMLLFSMLAGLVFGRLDAKYWQGGGGDLLFMILYPFLVGWTFFFVRGDMMSSLGYMVGTSLSLITVLSVVGYLSRAHNSTGIVRIDRL